MFAIIHLLATFIADVFKPPRRLEVENLFLRHQLNIALRRAPQRVRLRAGDRALLAGICLTTTFLPLSQPQRHRFLLAGNRVGAEATPGPEGAAAQSAATRHPARMRAVSE